MARRSDYSTSDKMPTSQGEQPPIPFHPFSPSGSLLSTCTASFLGHIQPTNSRPMPMKRPNSTGILSSEATAMRSRLKTVPRKKHIIHGPIKTSSGSTSPIQKATSSIVTKPLILRRKSLATSSIDSPTKFDLAYPSKKPMSSYASTNATSMSNLLPLSFVSYRHKAQKS